MANRQETWDRRNSDAQVDRLQQTCEVLLKNNVPFNFLLCTHERTHDAISHTSKFSRSSGASDPQSSSRSSSTREPGGAPVLGFSSTFNSLELNSSTMGK